jgi:ATP-dependent Lon protease
MVTTRSHALALQEDGSYSSDDGTLSTKDKSTSTSSSSSKSASTSASSSKSVSTSTSGAEEEEEEEEEYEEEEFEISEEIMNDAKLRPKVDKVVNYILKQTPTLEDILKSPMRLRHKAKIFELYMIYDQTLPMTEERMILRTQLSRLYTLFKQDYKQFLKNKDEILTMEKDAKMYSEYENVQAQILALPASSDIKLIIYRKFVELRDNPETDSKLRAWLKEALRLPFDNIKVFDNSPEEMNKKLLETRAILDKELFGMEKVKEQLLLFLHAKMVNPNSKGCCLALVGPPGVGKTSIAKCLARAMELPFEQISFGGVQSSEFVKGHDYTYVGSKPGEIARCLIRMRYKNGIMFFDEYDKISQNKDIVSSLLHITDFSQNHEFRDNYFSDITIDLSSLWFIYSMNEIPEDSALQDRLFIIKIDGYTEKDKIQIVIRHLFPKYLKNLCIDQNNIVIDEETACHLIRKCNKPNKGIRDIERLVKDVITKLSFIVQHGDMKVSFGLTKKLSYPVTLTKEIIDGITKSNEENTSSYLNMYI